MLGFGLVGLLVGVVPVALGMLWLPSLRRARPEWLAAFMALTAGLLSFLALEALSEAFALQAALPSALGGAGVVLLGFVVSYLTLTYLSHKLAALATLVAIGIGLHNFGEGLAIGTSFAFGELALGYVPDHRLHDPQRHRGSRDRNSRDRGAPGVVRPARLAAS